MLKNEDKYIYEVSITNPRVAMSNIQFLAVDITEIAEKLKSISHPIRLSIVKGLIQDGYCNVNGIKDKFNERDIVKAFWVVGLLLAMACIAFGVWI